MFGALALIVKQVLRIQSNNVAEEDEEEQDQRSRVNEENNSGNVELVVDCKGRMRLSSFSCLSCLDF